MFVLTRSRHLLIDFCRSTFGLSRCSASRPGRLRFRIAVSTTSSNAFKHPIVPVLLISRKDGSDTVHSRDAGSRSPCGLSVVGFSPTNPHPRLPVKSTGSPILAWGRRSLDTVFEQLDRRGQAPASSHLSAQNLPAIRSGDFSTVLMLLRSPSPSCRSHLVDTQSRQCPSAPSNRSR